MPIKMMILLIILSAALLPAILGAGTPIDWTKCTPTTKEYKCICLDSNKLAVQNDPIKILDNCKTSGIQIRSITEDITIYQMQENGAQNLGTTPELAIYNKLKTPTNPADPSAELLFGCKFIDGTATLLNNTHGASLFESRSFFESGNILCAIKVDKRTELYSKLDEGDSPFMKLTTSTQPVKRDSAAEFTKSLFGATAITCNTYAFQNLDVSSQYFTNRVMNRDQNHLNCNNYGELYQMRFEIDGSDGSGEDIDHLECKYEMGEYYLYYFKNIAGTLDEGTQIVNPESYVIYCAAPMEKMCLNPIKCDRQNDPQKECPAFSQGTSAGPAELTCPGKKWFINNEYFELQEDPKCKRDTMNDMSKAAFYFTFDSGFEQRVEENVTCFKEYSCVTKSRLSLPGCKVESDTCGNATMTENVLNCTDPKKRMKIHNVFLNTTSFACNKTNGKWENTTYKDRFIQQGTKISCTIEKLSLTSKQAAMSDTTLYLIIGGSIVGAIVAVIALFFLCLWLITRKTRQHVASATVWKKLKKEQKEEACKKLFVDVTDAEIGDNILAGLRMIERLLETETEYGSCYVDSENFLMRLQGSLHRMDPPTTHMFARYMYLQAKKIIDKHGWIATTPITNSNQKGLERIIAIFLLQFALGDRCNKDAGELIFDGFQKLGFNAVEQYPHCGKLWPLVLHALPYTRVADSDKPNATAKKFNYIKMHQYLEEIACNAKMEIPEGDKIPCFGSIAKQAAFALGGTPNQSYLKYNAERIFINLSKTVGVPLAFFKGCMYALSRNPTQNVMEACQQWPKINSDFLEKMYDSFGKEAKEADKIIDQTNFAVTCYGHYTDAKRLSTRLINKRLDEVEGETNTNLIKEKQETFDDALAKNLDEIREWFAKRTDIEELKKQPVHLKRSKGGAKVDNRIIGDKPAKVVTGGTLSKSKSRSDSKSKSSEGTDKARTPAAAAAASPAAPSPAATASTPSDAAPAAAPTQAPAS